MPLIKFIHVLTAVGLLAALFICLTLGRQTSIHKNHLIAAALLAALSGLLLIYPAHFNLHTPWIQVAIAGVSLFILIVFFFFPTQITVRPRQRQAVSLLLIALLLIIVHDAVTKTTFLLPSHYS